MPTSDDFWHKPSAEQLAAEQGVEPADLDKLIGAGSDLWESDEQLDDFLAGIYQRRRSG